MRNIDSRTRSITDAHAIAAGHAARCVHGSFDGLCRGLGDLEPSWAGPVGEIRSEENCNSEANLNLCNAIASGRLPSCRRIAGSREALTACSYFAANRATAFANGRTGEKFNAVCSCALGCCSLQSTNRRGGIIRTTTRVRWIFAWQAGQSEIIRERTDFPGTRW